MQEILKKIQELLGIVIAKNTVADARDKQLSLRGEAQDEVRKTQEATAKDLAERETKVAEVEDILAVKQENKDTLIKIGQEKEDFASAISAHKDRIAKSNSEIEIREKGIRDDFATLRAEQEKLKQDLKDLEIKAQALKKGGAFLKIIDEVVKAGK